MNESVGTNERALIDACQKSERSRNRARRSITVLILAVVAVFGVVLGALIARFRNQHAAEFRTALGTEVGQLAPRLGSDLAAMADRLYPVYVASFERMLAKEGPEIQRLGMEEMKKLDAQAQASWPKIEAGLADVVSNAESTAQVEMSRFVAPKEAEAMSVAYGEALQKSLDSLLATTLKEHVAVAEEIGTNLTKLAATEPDIRQPVNMQATAGILLELTGIELQGGK